MVVTNFALLLPLLVVIGAQSRAHHVRETPRIIGGVPVIRGQYSFAAAYFMKFSNAAYRFLCGSSVISETHAISAAHCVINKTAPAAIRAGSVNLNFGGQFVAIAKSFIHQNYSQQSGDCDIALFKLERPLRWTRSLRKINLPPADLVLPDGTPTFVVGWGITLERSVIASPTLLEVQLNIFDWEQCAEIKNEYKLGPKQICAGGADGKDSCEGDSGGGMVYRNMLVGVVSYGTLDNHCGVRGMPGVYTYIPSYLDWINLHMEK